MEIILLIAALLIGIVLFFIFKSNGSFKINSSQNKKEQIKQNYMNELKEILRDCQTKEEKLNQKKIFMQKVNSELSRNIFFDENESKELLRKLSVF